MTSDVSVSSADILIVEDNPDDLDLALAALRSHNIANRIQVARDGEQALNYLFARGQYAGRNERDLPKVILLDLKLPKISGIEVLRAVKTGDTTRRIPVVVLTSSREDRDVIETYDLGVNSYVQKPVSFVEFSEAVAKLGFYWMLLNQRAHD